MSSIQLILEHFSEVRRRSIILWSALPQELMFYRPDERAMSAIAMIRHVLEADYGWNKIIKGEDMSNYSTPWANRALVSLQDELDFAEQYRQVFLDTVSTFSYEDLTNSFVNHPGIEKPKPLGLYLNRIAYHESVHAGQFTAYLRGMNVAIPNIWD